MPGQQPHDALHGYVGGTIVNWHTSFEDKFDSGPALPRRPAVGEVAARPVLEHLEPWAGGTGTRPEASPDDQHQTNNRMHPAIVEPRYED
ncbi:hypothetical protein [Spirilliplanes yamanashiensis]|uniref:Uncharacterized protein n=1 Tax=Spirilliplanes yamanashiensis TaxID=42233 RepID=A0A8J3YFB2_9ACTN|nr:hypothetical protein [Spirilliplanes yamanashiensis]MDP9818402.1 hypothetical protein [Spirilliplanes yamanashiensis]GIJ06623.1 hypothetical protein Sya03_59750 [Spirilliplanes yamanashiensis]